MLGGGSRAVGVKGKRLTPLVVWSALRLEKNLPHQRLSLPGPVSKVATTWQCREVVGSRRCQVVGCWERRVVGSLRRLSVGTGWSPGRPVGFVLLWVNM